MSASVALLRHSPSLHLSPVVVVPDLVQVCGMEWAGPEHSLGWHWGSLHVVMGIEVTELPSEVLAASVVLLG